MKIILDNLFEMSLTASVIILTVILVRVLLCRCPKKFSYILWAVVGLRLCIPVTFESSFSIFNLFVDNDMPTRIPITASPVTNAVDTIPQEYKIMGSIWLAGCIILAIYGIFTYYRLQSKLSVSFPMGDSVYGVEGLTSPFVMGFFEPRIYIPLGLDKKTEAYVLMHERTHLRRGDHIVKLFAFGLLCIHWFNPFCWIAFVLMSRDMEMSCDEKVLGTQDIVCGYSNALLFFAQKNRFPSPGPLCFGEVGVKRRIKNILSFKQPGLWITLFSCSICIAVFVSCSSGAVEEKAANPLETKTETVEISGTTSDTTTADTTTIDTTTVDTTIIDTTTVVTTVTTTTAADTTIAPTVAIEPPVTGRGDHNTETEQCLDDIITEPVYEIYNPSPVYKETGHELLDDFVGDTDNINNNVIVVFHDSEQNE